MTKCAAVGKRQLHFNDPPDAHSGVMRKLFTPLLCSPTSALKVAPNCSVIHLPVAGNNTARSTVRKRVTFKQRNKQITNDTKSSKS